MILRHAKDLLVGTAIVLELGTGDDNWNITAITPVQNGFVTFHINNPPPGAQNGLTVFATDYVEVVLLDLAQRHGTNSST